MNFEHFAILMLNCKQIEPPKEIRSIISELMDLDSEEDSGFARFEAANLGSVPLIQVYETALKNLGVTANISHAAWFIVFLLSDGKHPRIVLYLTLLAFLAARNYGTVNARILLNCYRMGVPSALYLDTLYELSLNKDGSCELLNTKWTT